MTKSSLRIRELTEERAKLVTEMRAIDEKARTEKRAFTAEDDSAWQKLSERVDGLRTSIEREERMTTLEAELEGDAHPERRSGTERTAEGAAGDQAKAEKERRAFDRWARFGMEELSAEERAIMRAKHTDIPNVRAQGVATGAAGGFTVPQAFQAELDKALKLWGGMRRVSRILPTATGADLPWPTANDTAQEGELLGENTPAAEQDVTFGSKTIKAYMYSSKIVRVSLQLLQDSAFNLDAELGELLAIRLGRITNKHFTTGDGTNKPEGVVTASTQGKEGAAGQVTSIIYDDLVDLIHSVDVLYRERGSFMFHDQTLGAIRKLKDSEGRPLLFPSLDPALRDRILGYPYVVNNDVATMAANAKSALFGDFSKYVIRDVLDFRLVRLTERYADSLQVAFIGFLRSDGKLIDAGTNPIKHYKNPAA